MFQHVLIDAAFYFQGVGEFRHLLERALVVDGACEINNGGGQPRGVEGGGAEWISEDAAE
jgi:hypothetical protein